MLRTFFSYFIFLSLKCISIIFFKVRGIYITPKETINWDEVRIVALLNHTSLYEPVLIGAAPARLLWNLAGKMVAPGADKTMNRPIVGKLWRLIFPHLISISRQRDDTWSEFMELIKGNTVIVLAPEGRMRRPSGYDLNGNPMTVRGGIADILGQLTEGKMMIAYSGGLHHIQKPGELIPRLFKEVNVAIEVLDIPEYKASLEGKKKFKLEVVKDLEQRMDRYVPLNQGNIYIPHD